MFKRIIARINTTRQYKSGGFIMEQEKLAINVKEMAKLLGISAKSAYDLVKTPGFPLIRVGKRQLIPTEALKKWLDEQKS